MPQMAHSSYRPPPYHLAHENIENCEWVRSQKHSHGGYGGGGGGGTQEEKVENEGGPGTQEKEKGVGGDTAGWSRKS